MRGKEEHHERQQGATILERLARTTTGNCREKTLESVARNTIGEYRENR